MSDIPPPPPPDGPIPPPPLLTHAGTGPGAQDAIWFDPHGDYAGFWRRAGGKVIDSIVLGLIALLCLVPAIVVFATGDSELEPCFVDQSGDEVIEDYDLVPNAMCEYPTGTTIGLGIAAGLAGAVPIVLVNVWYYRRQGRTGRTWGRDATGTRLVDADTGRPIGAAKVFGREIVGNVFAYALGLNFLWCTWDRRKQTWQDKVMTSVVVRDRS